MEDCDNSSANALELTQYCAKPSIWLLNTKEKKMLLQTFPLDLASVITEGHLNIITMS